MKRFIFALSFLLYFFGCSAQIKNVVTDSSVVAFSIDKMGNSVSGTITGMKGQVSFSKAGVSSIEVCIDPATINTEHKTRDKHLKSDDYFDVETFPTICFYSGNIEKAAGAYKAKGTLTMHGISKEITIPIYVNKNVIMGTITIDRYEFGIGKKGDMAIGREVEITIKCVVE